MNGFSYARLLKDQYPVYVIAEAGSNHNGNLETARVLVKAAKDAGADAIKFQSFKPETLVHPKKMDAFGVLDRFQLPSEWHAELSEYAAELGIDFVSTPFDKDAVDLLDELDVPFIKIASGDLTHLTLIEYAASKGRPLLISTGAAKLPEVEAAVNAAAAAGEGRIILLHCTAQYPTPSEDVHLLAMRTLRETFRLPVGYSDHTLGITVPVAATALGAVVIEKHFSLDRRAEGPDHPHSLEPDDLRRMIGEIRTVTRALGDKTKVPTATELARARQRARRGVYAAVDLPAGTVLREQHLLVVRPAGPLSPSDLPDVIGTRVPKPIAKGTPIEWSHLEA